MSKEINLTQGKVSIVDDDDFERLNAYKWHCYKAKNGNFYAVRNGWFGPFRKTIYMAREVMRCTSAIEVDHVNPDNTLDNRKSNLRFVTHTENGQNRRKQTNGTSRFKGVSFHKSSRKWQARIRVNGNLVHLGLFVSETEAATAYDDAAKIHFGKYANTNF